MRPIKLHSRRIDPWIEVVIGCVMSTVEALPHDPRVPIGLAGRMYLQDVVVSSDHIGTPFPVTTRPSQPISGTAVGYVSCFVLKHRPIAAAKSVQVDALFI
jgi:hypothetical protein